MPDRLTLFTQLSSRCSIGCALCPWKEFLNESDLNIADFSGLLDSGRFGEVVITCPLSDRLEDFSKEVRRRGINLIYMLHSRSVRPTRELLNADELFLLVDYAEDMVRVRNHVMVLLSHGYERINFLMQLIPGVNDSDLQSVLSTCNKWGLRLWISPPLFKCDSSLKLERVLRTRLSQKSFCLLGAFSAPALVGESPLFLMESRRENCNILFLNPDGLRRCPMSQDVISDIPEEMICPVGRRKPFLLVTRVYLITSRGTEFDERDLMLLDLIDRVRSIRGAAKQLGISISTRGRCPRRQSQAWSP